MRFLILSILSLTLFAGDEKAPPQPIEVIHAVAAYEKSLATIRKEYEAKEAKIRDEAVKKLEKAKSDYAKRGDLDGGVLCQDVVKKFRDGDMMKDGEEKLKEKGLFENAVSAKPFPGSWSCGNDTLTFNKNGTWASPWSNFGGTWKMADGKVIVVSDKGNNGTSTIVPKDGETWSFNGSVNAWSGVAKKQ